VRSLERAGWGSGSHVGRCLRPPACHVRCWRPPCDGLLRKTTGGCEADSTRVFGVTLSRSRRIKHGEERTTVKAIRAVADL
jgi:hypothetical protein